MEHPATGAALLIMDMISRFDFPGAETLEPRARTIIPVIEGLVGQCDALDYPVIYVNDNFGEWHSDRTALIDCALERHNPIAEKLRPRGKDYFILKPQFSRFYATNLPVLPPRAGKLDSDHQGITQHHSPHVTRAELGSGLGVRGYPTGVVVGGSGYRPRSEAPELFADAHKNFARSEFSTNPMGLFPLLFYQ